MSEIPSDADLGGEELDLGEVDEIETDLEGSEDGAEGSGEGDAADGDEGQEGDGQEDDVAPARARRPGRSERLRERLERTERELAEARGFQRAAEQFRPQQQAPQIDPVAAQRAREQRDYEFSLMTPQQVAERIAEEKGQQFQQALLFQQLNIQDQIDKRDYEQQSRSSRVHAQYKDEVERTLREKRAAGDLLINREEILDRIIGRAARERASRAAPAQRRAAAQRRNGQQARPTGARGDGAAASGRGKWGDPEFDEQMAREGLRKGIF